MSLKRNVVYSSILTTSLYIFQFLTYPYVARVLGVVNIGICNFVQSLVQYFALFAILGTVTVGAREIAKCNSDKERLNQVFSSIVILNVLLTVMVLVCYIGATCFIPQFFKYKKLLYIGVFQLLSTPFTVEWLYRGLEDFKYITYRNLLVRAIYVLLIFALVRDRDDYYIYFALTVGLYVINAAINIFYCRHFVSFCWQPIVECCRKYIKPISFLGVQNILITMYTSFNVVFLGFFAGDKQVGYYTTATKIHGMILALFSAFTLVMMPRISSLVSMKKNEQVKYLLRQSISILFAFSFPMVIVVVALAPYIIQLIAGAEFVESVNLLRLSIPLIIVVGIEQILITQLLIPLGEDKSSSKSYIAGGIIGLISNVLLVPHWSSVGAIVVWALSEFTVMSFALFYVEQRLKLTRIICCSFFRYLLSFAPLAILVYCLASSPLCVIMLSIIYSHICLFYVIRNDIYVNAMKQMLCKISRSCLNDK